MSTYTKTSKPLVSIVVITWNAKAMLKRCLSSLKKSSYFDVELVIVDNGSNDGTAEMIRESHPGAKLIRNGRNRGVAPARNQGLRSSRGDFLLIVDDDAYLGPGSIEKFIAFLSMNPTVGLCGPRLIDESGRRIPSCKRFPTPLSFALNRFPELVNAHNKFHLDAHLMRDWDHKTAAPVDYVIGACQFIRRKALDAVGLLDDKIFYGPEDIDFCLRLWMRRWQVYYVPEICVVHAPRRMTKQKTWTLVSIRHALAIKHFFLKYRIGLLRNLSAKNDIARRIILENQQ
ncbi:MAG: glycosyltransferase family 2 protein [candidate division WOR-3 bacterium]|nr:MAG: glycosyltransferase family 2 protein [candidate division WOR-3 bacterium]